MPYHLVLAELLDLGWHREWEQCLRLLWLRRCVRGRHCSSDGTMWALDTLSDLRNMCLGVRRQAPLLWEKVCKEWDWPRFPCQDESPPPWTRQPGLPEVSHPLNLHEYLPTVSPASMSPVFPGGTARGRSIRQHALQRQCEEPVSTLLVPTHVCLGAPGAIKLLVSIPTLPQRALCPHLGTLAHSKPTLAPCLASRDENKLQ